MEVLPAVGVQSTSQSRVELGLVYGLEADEYHAGPGISQSGLKTFAEPGGPAKYKAGVRKDSRALKFGGAFHTATLEPWLLEKQYCPTDLEREGTKAWQAEELAAGGRILLKRKEWDDARYMRDSVMGHRTASQLITPELEREVSMFWVDPGTSMLCRGRADGMRRDWKVIVDLKSTNDASRDGFAKSISEWGYDWQNYYYGEGYRHCTRSPLDTFIFIAVEKEKPFLTACYYIDPLDIQAAGTDVRDALRALKHCRETDEWPGYDEELTLLRVPQSRRRKLPYNAL